MGVKNVIIYLTNSDAICEGLMNKGVSVNEINENVDSLYVKLNLDIVAGAHLMDDGDQIISDEVFAEWINKEYGVTMLAINLHSKNSVEVCHNNYIGL